MKLFRNKIDTKTGKVFRLNNETKEIMTCINNSGY